MGCTISTEKKQSSAIDKELANEKRHLDREIKVLLLGAGESGKSTIAKQMRYIHTDGFKDDEVKDFRDIMQSNVLQCLQTLIRNLEQFNLNVEDPLTDRAKHYARCNTFELPLESHMCDDIKSLWSDPAIQQLYEDHRDKINLPDVAGYCMKHIDRIGAEDYIPTQDDVLRCRQRTTGMKETEFMVEDVKFRLLDVGGQKNERKKWMHYFDDVRTIIFCVSLSDYNMNLVEDGATNRLQDSVKLWADIVNNPLFKNVSIVLFFNKNDLFREKIIKDPIVNYHREFQGGSDYDRCLEFIRNKYLSRVPPGKSIVAHVTTAIDVENITVVFDAVRRNIINQILKIHF
ncbi:hypothetical protein SAMD00019534_068620 [Acytostelium subglobosum LB1]|uniref:hypothetical protein n=1 Tax=Acytostelium subglobosum LB1 TaxID=1410327 RepID=UPI000644B09A|nr:hypothetical protein SAMD00019534_068620 [Acytostelium subglobosum LB1]GAM23687.1 hypothetical protein SAMD00019534_068620 [Acytostelium subglobosum LB1]|eukprot:XP_012753428.1 hypothetical protein SAMD00019534_068620 [Acytostelium subglobosum LB1]